MSASESLKSLLRQAENPWAGEGMNTESVLSLEVQGKYVDVLFTTGGPHIEVQFEFDDADEAEYWFEQEPSGGVLNFANWGTRELIPVGRHDARTLMAALSRDPEEMLERFSEVTITVFGTRDETTVEVEVELGDAWTAQYTVDDYEPADVWTPLLQRALDEALYDVTVDRQIQLPGFDVDGWTPSDDADDDDMTTFKVTVVEREGE